MDARAGRVLSAKNEKRLQDALALLSDVLAQLATDDDGRAVRGIPGAFEQRTAYMGGVEVRAEDEAGRISGYAAVFDEYSVPLFGFRERIAPGAFADSLGDDVRALWQHDTSRVLGRTTNGSLRLWEDDAGLGFDLTPPDTQDGRDAIELIRRGDVDQMSFGFTVPKGGDDWTEEGGQAVRTVKTANLIEISPVTFPAYLGTSADVVRNAPEWVQRALDFEGVDDTAAIDLARARLERQRHRLKILKLETTT